MDERDEASVKRFLAAVSPIDEHRSKHETDESIDEEEIAVETAVPVAPAA